MSTATTRIQSHFGVRCSRSRMIQRRSSNNQSPSHHQFKLPLLRKESRILQAHAHSKANLHPPTMLRSRQAVSAPLPNVTSHWLYHSLSAALQYSESYCSYSAGDIRKEKLLSSPLQLLCQVYNNLLRSRIRTTRCQGKCRRANAHQKCLQSYPRKREYRAWRIWMNWLRRGGNDRARQTCFLLSPHDMHASSPLLPSGASTHRYTASFVSYYTPGVLLL